MNKRPKNTHRTTLPSMRNISVRNGCVLLVCTVLVVFAFLYPITITYAQNRTTSVASDTCDAVKSLIKETAIKQGVPAHIMAIESLRFEESNIITHYSVNLSQSVAPENLAAAIRGKSKSAGYSVNVEVVSANRFLMRIFAGAIPCVEMLCITPEPLPISFAEMLAPPQAGSPSPEVNADVEEMEKVLEQENDLVETPDSQPLEKESDTSADADLPSEQETGLEEEHKSLIASVLALKRRTELRKEETAAPSEKISIPEPDASPETVEINMPELVAQSEGEPVTPETKEELPNAVLPAEGETTVLPQPEISPIPDAQIYEHELMQKPESIQVKVAEPEEKTTSVSEPLVPDVPEIPVQPETATIPLPVENTPEQQPPTIEAQQETSPIPDAQIFEQELMQKPEIIHVEVPEPEEEIISFSEPLVPDVPEITVQPETETIALPVENTPDEQPPTIEPQQELMQKPEIIQVQVPDLEEDSTSVSEPLVPDVPEIPVQPETETITLPVENTPDEQPSTIEPQQELMQKPETIQVEVPEPEEEAARVSEPIVPDVPEIPAQPETETITLPVENIPDEQPPAIEPQQELMQKPEIIQVEVPDLEEESTSVSEPLVPDVPEITVQPETETITLPVESTSEQQPPAIEPQQELMQKPEIIQVEVPEPEEESTSVSEPLVPDVPEIPVQPETETITLPVENTPEQQPAEIEPQQEAPPISDAHVSESEPPSMEEPVVEVEIETIVHEATQEEAGKLPEPVEEQAIPPLIQVEVAEEIKETPNIQETTNRELEAPREGEPEEATATEQEGEIITPEPVEELRPGKIALILDDGGYGGTVTERVLQLDTRITLAILPDTPFAGSTARNALAKGFEIILHMPMQSSTTNTIHAFPGELSLTMAKEEIQKRTRECLEQFPNAVGVNNHTGADFTVDAERMGWFLEIVKEYEIFFVDSRTTWESCAHGLAVKMGIPTARRTIFLDNSSDPAEIRRYLNELITRARAQGTAIGIGHFRSNTITVLEEELPKLMDLKIELIRVSEVVR